jgi:hypothetical protein
MEIVLNILTRKYSDVIKSKELLMFRKLLPILFLFTGFQANAVLIGNLTYDGTYISGDGRTYLGLNTIASWDYATTLAATQVGGQYEGFRIANTADADFFIGSLFGSRSDGCSNTTTFALWHNCGDITGWTDGMFGANFDGFFDTLLYYAPNSKYAGYLQINRSLGVGQIETFIPIGDTDKYSDRSPGSTVTLYMSWLLVKDTVVSVPEPSIIALMGLGIFGIGFARRRRQS